MSQLSREDILKLARLSRFKLSDDEIKSLQAQLSEILNYVQQLDGVDVQGLEPTYQVTGLKNVTRPDEIIDYQAKPDDLLKNAPSVVDHQFKVKRVL